MIPAPLRYRRRDFFKACGLGLAGLFVTERLHGQPAEAPLLPPAPPDRLDGPPIVSARAWAIAEGSSGRILWGANEADRLNMASTTKIMTALLVLQETAQERRLLDENVIISERAAGTTGSSARIRAGDRFTVRELLYGLLLPSGNDAAVALAEHFNGRFRGEGNGAAGDDSTAAFVARMNREAETLRLPQTRYYDPHGLGRNHTSARDLTVLARTAMRDELFRECVRCRRRSCEVTDAQGMRRTVVWTNTNRLLGIQGYEGIKTGTTTAAGACLVSSGRRGEDHLYVVVLGCTSSDSRYVDTRNLYRWAWLQRGHR